MKTVGNKILITGATSGIGEAILEAYIQADNEVIAVGRNEEKLKLLAAKDKRIIPFKCDVARQEDLKSLVRFIENDHSDLNILINNAGIQYNYHFGAERHAIDKIEKEINVNLTAPIKLVSLLLPTIQKNKNAAIVNVTSGLGLVPKMSAPVYCATKAALHIFSQSLRYQLETVKVFEIIPPLVDTNMTKGRGTGKITPQQLAEEFMRAFRRDNYEVNIGKVKLLKTINRLAPSVAKRIMKGDMSAVKS